VPWMDRYVIHNCQFEGDTFCDAQPVNADERWGNESNKTM